MNLTLLPMNKINMPKRLGKQKIKLSYFRKIEISVYTVKFEDKKELYIVKTQYYILVNKLVFHSIWVNHSATT